MSRAMPPRAERTKLRVHNGAWPPGALSIAQAARAWGMSAWTVKWYVKSGRVAAVYVPVEGQLVVAITATARPAPKMPRRLGRPGKARTPGLDERLDTRPARDPLDELNLL